jgi:hypothetical protein
MQLELCDSSCEPVASKLEVIGRVPHVRQSVHGSKMTGDPDFLQRGATNIVVCGFH